MRKRVAVAIVVALMIVVTGTLGASNLVNALRGHENSVQKIIGVLAA